MYLHFDWSNICDEFFRRKLVKSILTIFFFFGGGSVFRRPGYKWVVMRMPR